MILHRNIENNDRQYDERYQINMIDDKESDERYQIGEKKEETLNTDIEVLKLRKLSSQKKDYLEKYPDEINHMDMSDDKESDERYQMSKNDKEKVTEYIKFLKLGKLSSQRNIENIEK